MRLPLNWLKEFIDYGKKSPQELAEIFTLLGHEVERIEDPAKSLEKIVVGKVLKIKEHPNADKLRIVETKAGSRVYKIICGGSNLREGMTTVVALPGARVRWHGQGDLVELKETEIRGVKSAGMICASPEIGLETFFPSKQEREIIDLSKQNLDQKDGTPLAKALGLGPILHLDITPNRADCLSILGLARELAAGLGERTDPRQAQALEKYSLNEARNAKLKGGLRQAQAVKIFIENKKLCPKYTAQVFTNIKVGESPLFIQSRLWMAGVRPINNIVDISNYLMLETGEPTHAFDLDKLGQKQFPISNFQFPIKVELFIRNAKEGERIKALDGNTYELDETMLVVADQEKLIAIAGVMGGEETGVTAETKNILLEAAIFDPVSVRKTSRKLNLRSESSARFERGISWLLPELAQTQARSLLEQISGVKCQVLNVLSTSAPKSIFITQKISAINQMLNLELTPARLKSILTSLGFKCSRSDLEHLKGKVRVQVPSWRLDINIPEDLYEEVGRIYGLSKLKATRLHGEIILPKTNSLHRLTEAARDFLLALGFDEVYNYSFYGRETIEKDGSSADREPHLQIENPINPNQEYLRTNLLRNLLGAASHNARIFDKVKIFEIGKVFHPLPRSEKSESHSNNPNLLTREETHLALVSTAKGANAETLWQKFKGEIIALLGKEKQAEFRKSKNGLDIFFSDTWVGWMGPLLAPRQSAWKIKDPCLMAEFNLGAVLAAKTHPLKYSIIFEFPLGLRDLAIVVDESIPYIEVEKVLRDVDPLVTNIELFDLYRGGGVAKNKKSLAFHITLQSSSKTLSDNEIDTTMQKLANLLKEKFNANVRE